jgi:hypothetical protein
MGSSLDNDAPAVSPLPGMWQRSWQSAAGAIEAARKARLIGAREAAARQAALRAEIAATGQRLRALTGPSG